MVQRDFTPGFRCALHHKDLGILTSAARDAGVTIPLGAMAAQLMGALVAQGHGDLDNTALLQLVEELSGGDVDETPRRQRNVTEPGTMPSAASTAATAPATAAPTHAPSAQSVAISFRRVRIARRSDNGNRCRSRPTASASTASADVSDEAGSAEHHRVAQVPDQLVVQPTVGLVRAVDRDDVQDPMIVALEDADVDQAVLHGPVRTPAEVTHPVVRPVRSARFGDGSQRTVQQRLAGRTLLGEVHLLVDEGDPLP